MSHCTLQPLRTSLKRLEPVIPHPQSKDEIPRLTKDLTKESVNLMC
jgi:hypothetical protein